MGIAGPRAWHPLFPAWGGSAGPGPSRRGICFAGRLFPPVLFSCSGITSSSSPKSFRTLCFVGLGRSDPAPNPSQPWKRAGCCLSWPWRRWPRVGFLSPLIPGAVGAAPSQCPSPRGDWQGLEVAPVSLWHRHTLVSHCQVPSFLYSSPRGGEEQRWGSGC